MLVGMLVMACGSSSPTPTASPAAHCVSLPDGDVLSLAWSQAGTHLSVGVKERDGRPAARTIDVPTMTWSASAYDPGMLAESVVLSATGRLAWLRAGAGTLALVEDGPAGRRVVELPAGVQAIQWTAIGYAAIERPAADLTRIILVDPARPASPTVLHETTQTVEQLWVTPDPEWVVLGVSADGGSPTRGFIVVGPTRTVAFDVADADGSAVSMTPSRSRVVYRSAESGQMKSVAVSNPAEPRVLWDQPVKFGTMSGRGVLAAAIASTPAAVCLVDVAP
jgi:hypothetical protein